MVRYSLEFGTLKGNQKRDWEHVELSKIRAGSCVFCNKRDGRNGVLEQHRQTSRDIKRSTTASATSGLLLGF